LKEAEASSQISEEEKEEKEEEKYENSVDEQSQISKSTIRDSVDNLNMPNGISPFSPEVDE